MGMQKEKKTVNDMETGNIQLFISKPCVTQCWCTPLPVIVTPRDNGDCIRILAYLIVP